MSDLSERLESAQYALMMTAHVVLEVRWGIGPLMVLRRKRSVFVPDRLGAVVMFPADDVMGQEPRRASASNTRSHMPHNDTTPSCRWFLTSQAPMFVNAVKLTHDGSATEGPKDEILADLCRPIKGEKLHVGAVAGQVRVPAHYHVSFGIVRDLSWSESVRNGVKENGK